ncbi:hypothetical protein NP493_2061g00051 [Ridgeia piscesae]|uniref:Nucleolar protein 10 n=1 Tax=Ridgeia piscesae TaxID=27915 RepID=A0AAD9JLV6_RIDPI|nr:hypothetical protein NP493_2061g00051 [Ridgeia piscesae]
MPTVSNCIVVSKDGQYILATGVYKPRVRCYDVSQLSMKFERCMDSEVVKLVTLNTDYSKLIFLQTDRFLELHAQHGRYYRTRIPKYGRDMAYHDTSCDLYVVGVSPEIYRLNLEQGRFMSSLKTDATEINCCEFNPVHQLFACGTHQGCVECWDPRTRNRVGLLDCALGSLLEDAGVDGVPAVTALKFRDGLQLGVGTSTGQILMYDIRSNKPLLLKDHMYGLPIRNIAFHKGQDLVLSCDTRILKLWERETGKAFTSIEPGTELNNMCVVPDTGMIFLAHEAPKMLTYYIPALGAAPKWCSFLDSLTEELEENPAPSVYDDYKFVTRTELDSLGLTHLIGSSLLRAYMHGFFMDIRLYHKAKSLAEPFAYEEYRRSKIREKIEHERANRVKVKKLPRVNKDLAEKLLEEEQRTDSKKRQKVATGLLKDDRFSQMFSNTAFQIDTESDEYRLVHPLVSKLDKDRRKHNALTSQFSQVVSEEDEEAARDDSSSDDEHTWTQEAKKKHRKLKDEDKIQRKQRAAEAALKPKFFELSQGTELDMRRDEHHQHKSQMRKSLGTRVKEGEESGAIQERSTAFGNMELTFKLQKDKSLKKHQIEEKQHHAERKKLRRSAGQLSSNTKQPPKFWQGKRVG